MVIYEENAKRIVVPSGLGNLTGLMEAEAQAMYNSGRTDGYNEGVEDGKSMQDRKLTDSVTFNENGEYDADYGYKKVIVDVDKQWDEGYESGFTDGYASGYTDGLPKYDYTMRITYPMEKDGSYLLMEMCGMRAPFCLNGKEYPYTFEHDHDPWTQPVNYNYIFIKAEGVNGNGPFISVDMEPYFLDRPVEGGRRYPTPDEMTITFGGVPMTVTAWTMGEYDDEYYGRYYQPYHIECEPLSLDRYDIGFSDGYASGYTDGQASCPECSGSTDCSSAITEAFESGYTAGYNSGYTTGQEECEGGCDDYLECRTTVSFAEDTVIPAPSVGVGNYIIFNLDMAYTFVYNAEGWEHDGETLHSLIFNEVTLPAGTYNFRSVIKQNGEWYSNDMGGMVFAPNDTIPGGVIGSRFYFNESEQ